MSRSLLFTPNPSPSDVAENILLIAVGEFARMYKKIFHNNYNRFQTPTGKIFIAASSLYKTKATAIYPPVLQSIQEAMNTSCTINNLSRSALTAEFTKLLKENPSTVCQCLIKWGIEADLSGCKDNRDLLGEARASQLNHKNLLS